MKKSTVKQGKHEDEVCDCGGVFIDMSSFYKEVKDEEGLKQYRKEMRGKGYVCSNGMWVPKECL